MASGGYVRSVPVRRLRHPLEESPVWGLLGGALGALLALLVGVPVLALLAVLVPVTLAARWLLLLLHWNRQPATAGGGPESVRGNDGRWLGAAWRRSVMHAVLVFEAGLDVARLRQLLLSRVVPRYPRLTRRPVALPLSAGAGHCWLPDAAFSIERHVFAGRALVATERQLQLYVGSLLDEGLARDKPPWELHVLSGVGANNDTVVVLRVHQSVADGTALVRMLCHSLADCHGVHEPQQSPLGAVDFPLSVARALLLGPLSVLLWLLLPANDCNPLTHRKGWTGRVSVTWSAAITLPQVTRIKQVTRSTINCVLLSALAGAARRLLQGCGVRQPPDMKVVVPVDLRQAGLGPPSPRLGSKVAPVVIALPVSLEGAVPRLWAARRHLSALRSSADAVVVYVATAALMAVAPGHVARRVLSALTGNASLQFSSLPGPQVELRVGGLPLKGVYPLLPAQGSMGLAVSVFTYADQVYVTVASDSALRAAADALLSHLHSQIEMLWQLLLFRRVPGESRAQLGPRRADVAGSPVRELRLRLNSVQEEVQRLSEVPTGDIEPDDHLQGLKTEFSELLAELRRRGGSSPIFEDEDEDADGELWRVRPRRRAMSCTAVRRSSRSLVALLTARRPASFVCPQDSDSDENEACLPQWSRTIAQYAPFQQDNSSTNPAIISDRLSVVIDMKDIDVALTDGMDSIAQTSILPLSRSTSPECCTLVTVGDGNGDGASVLPRDCHGSLCAVDSKSDSKMQEHSENFFKVDASYLCMSIGSENTDSVQCVVNTFNTTNTIPINMYTPHHSSAIIGHMQDINSSSCCLVNVRHRTGSFSEGNRQEGVEWRWSGRPRSWSQ